MAFSYTVRTELGDVGIFLYDLAANASTIEFKDADALVCPDLLTVTGTGRVHFTGSRNQLGRVRIADGGWLRIARDTSIGPTPDVLDPAAITLDGGTLQNGGETTVAATRGLTLSERGGALGAGYDGNAHLTILSPITGPGGLDIAFETRPVVLSNPANDWAGDTRVGTAQCEHWGSARFALALGADDVLPHGPGKGRLVLAPLATATNAAATAPIDLAGHVATVNAVDASCKGVVKSSAPGGALKTCGDEDSDFRGTLASGATLEKHGAGTLALSAASASPIGKDTLLIKSDAGTVRIDPLAENLFRVRITKKDRWEESALNRYGVIARDWPACAVKTFRQT